MFKTVALRSVPVSSSGCFYALARPSSIPILHSIAHKNFSSAASRQAAAVASVSASDGLSKKPVDQKAAPGTEGLHRGMSHHTSNSYSNSLTVLFVCVWCVRVAVLRIEDKNPTERALTKHDAVSTVPTMVRGDWVLFHPVYSPEELRSVQASSSRKLGLLVRLLTNIHRNVW